MTEHSHTARQVIVAALAVPVPDEGPEGRVERQAALIEAALIQHGHLPDPHAATTGLTEDEVVEVAKWLARASRHPRYAEDGYTMLMSSERDVAMAGHQAEQRAMDSEAVQQIARARQVLLAWIDGSTQ